MLVAGVDSSTQSCKVVIRDAGSGEVVRTGRAAHPAGTEVDPEAWWLALVRAIGEAGGLGDVSAISVAGQQHGMVALDAAGRVIRPALLWNDTRSAAAAAGLVHDFGATGLARRTGSVPVASFTSAKLRWMREAEPRNALATAAVALPHDWLTWRLRGFGPGRAALDQLTTDRSDASGTGYWSPSDGGYDLELVEAALGSRPILPRVLAPEASAGVTDGLSEWGIPDGILVAAGMGDNAAGALGLGVGPGEAVLSIGTSGTVFAVSETPTHDPSGTVAGFADGAGAFLPLVATLNAARILDSMSELLGVDHDGLGALSARARPGADGLVLVPYFEGERTPNLPDASASLRGMTLASTTRENLARAAVEGLLCGLADGLEGLRAAGVTIDRLSLIGGAARNPAVVDAATHVFATPLDVPSPGEYVAAGAAVQAAWAATGERPAWRPRIDASPAPDHRPEVLERYRHWARQER